MDDLRVEIDTLVVAVDATTAEAIAAGRLDPLGAPLLAALYAHPALRDRLPAGLPVVTGPHGAERC